MLAIEVLRYLRDDLVNAEFPEEPADAANVVSRHWDKINEVVDAEDMVPTAVQQPSSPNTQAPASTHTDAFGKPLNIGDSVMFLGGWGTVTHKCFKTGKIVRLGKAKATIMDDEYHRNSYDDDDDYTDIVWYRQVAKI